MKKAVSELEAGNYQEADQILSSLLTPEGEPVEALIHRAFCRMRAGQLDGASLDAQKASQLRPESGVFKMIWGEILVDQKQFESAVRVLREAVSLEKDNGRALYQLGRALMALGKRAEAADYFEMALQFEKDYVMAQSMAHA